MNKSIKFVSLLSVSLCALVVGASTAQTPKPIKIGYIYKLGDAPWFVQESQAAQARAKKLGVTLLMQDVQSDANKAITAMDTMIADGVQGIAIVVPDTGLGPVVAAKAAKAGIPLVAVDDDIYDSNKKRVPYVGIDASALGTDVGKNLAAVAMQRGWNKNLKGLRAISIEIPGTKTCVDRTEGAAAGFMKVLPGFLKNQIIHVTYDGTTSTALDAVNTVLTANADAERFVVWSCNDNGVLGAVRATENARIAPTNVAGIGIDGSLLCDALGSGKPSGFVGSLYLSSAYHGEMGVQLLYDVLVNKKPLPAWTKSPGVYVNRSNFAQYKSKLGCK